MSGTLSGFVHASLCSADAQQPVHNLYAASLPPNAHPFQTILTVTSIFTVRTHLSAKTVVLPKPMD